MTVPIEESTECDDSSGQVHVGGWENRNPRKITVHVGDEHVTENQHADCVDDAGRECNNNVATVSRSQTGEARATRAMGTKL
jgi:hypothetical protein